MQRKFLLYFIVLLLSGRALGQTKLINQLQKENKSILSDTSRILLLCKLSVAYRSENPDSALHYAVMALDLAKKVDFKKGLLYGLNSVGFGYYLKGRYSEALTEFNKAIELELTHHIDKSSLIKNHNCIGNVYQYQGNYKASLKNYHRSLFYASELKDSMAIDIGYGNIGNVYMDQGDFIKALESYYKSLELCLLIKDTLGIAYNNSNISNVFYEQKDLRAALEYNFKALKIFQDLKEKVTLIQIYDNIGTIYGEMGNLGKEFIYFQKAYALAEELGVKLSVMRINNNLGSSYLKKKKYDLAYKSFLKAEKTANEMNSSTGLCITYNNLSELFHATGNHEKTIFYAQAAFDLSLKNKLKPQIRDASKMLYEHYKENGNPKKALYFLEYYSDYKDSLLNAENIRETKSVEFKYKLANNKKEIALLQKQNEIKQKQNALQQILLYGSIGFLALSLIYIVYYVKQVKTVRKLNLHLVETNFKIDKQNDLISEQAKGLEKLNDIKDKVISVISHDVKSPIASLYALMDLVINEPDRKSSDSMIHMAKASLKNVSLLLENLLTWAKVQIQNSDEDVPEKIDLHLIVSEVLSIYSSVALQKDVMLVNKVQQNNSISTYKNSILIIIRNLVSNAIKFSPGGESVIIQCNTEGTDILIQVIDKGIGMTKAELDKLFNVARLYTALGTCGEKGSGLGLIFVKDAVDRCRGTLKINSEKHRGTTFSCLLPDLA